ncbi:MAG: O-antigen ligase family protein [Flavobacteriales bacterium]|jgi:O-antigen ligase|nr:O-antigen ligase family protein [Flavobacteriales bacterium]
MPQEKKLKSFYRSLPFDSLIYYSSFIFLFGLVYQDFTKILLTLGISLVSFFWLLKPNYNEKWVLLRANKPHFYILIFLLFQALSIFWVENTKEYGRLLTLLTSIFLFAGVWGTTNFNEKKITNLKLFFLVILFLPVVYDLFLSFFDKVELSLKKGDSVLGKGIKHYLSTYICTALIIAISFLKRTNIRWQKLLLGIVVMFFLTAILLISSRIHFLFILIYSLFQFYKRRHVFVKKWKYSLSFIFVALLLLFFNRQPILYKFHETKDEIHSIFDETYYTSSNPRFYIWQDSYALIKDQILFGFGLGDEQQVLTQKAKKRDLYFWLDNKNVTYGSLNLNYHSQYIQTLATVGLFGFIPLILSIIFALRFSLKQTDKAAFWIIFLIATTMFTESILLRQWGTVYFAFFFLFFAKKK